MNKVRSRSLAILLFSALIISACAQSIASKDDRKFIEEINIEMSADELQKAINFYYRDKNIKVSNHEDPILWIIVEYACGQRNACTPSNLKEILKNRTYLADGTVATYLLPGIAIKQGLKFGQGFDEISMLAVFLDDANENVIGYIASGWFLAD